MTGREMLFKVCNAERLRFEAEDIITTVRSVSNTVTDDCTWSGVLLLACELLGCSEETLIAVLDEDEE